MSADNTRRARAGARAREGSMVVDDHVVV
jgi:hypothetical protein